jgi:hypothetical protein
MSSKRARIDTLTLRIPGLSDSEARDLGRAVAHRVAVQLPVRSAPLNLNVLELRVTVPPGTRYDEMVTRISEAILEALR